jgi:hypothetical protein
MRLLDREASFYITKPSYVKQFLAVVEGRQLTHAR